MKTNIGLKRLERLCDELHYRFFYHSDDNTLHVMTKIRECISEIKQYEDQMLKTASKEDDPAKLSDVEVGETKLIIKSNPNKGPKAIGGQDSRLIIDGVALGGVIDKEVNFRPGEIATLTVTMMLPEIVYTDE